MIDIAKNRKTQLNDFSITLFYCTMYKENSVHLFKREIVKCIVPWNNKNWN